MDGLGQAVALDIGIGGLLYGMSRLELSDVLTQQLPVEGVGMVEIDGMALLFGHVTGIVIIRVERNHGHIMRRQSLGYLFHYGGLA